MEGSILQFPATTEHAVASPQDIFNITTESDKLKTSQPNKISTYMSDSSISLSITEQKGLSNHTSLKRLKNKKNKKNPHIEEEMYH